MVKFTLNLDGPLVQLPNKLSLESFDYVGRYQLIGEIIARYFKATKPRNVLDVGGHGGFIDKLVAAPVTILDEEGDESKSLTHGDGARMNVADNAYDVVISSDTLEHIPKKDRKKFVNELVRVSDDLVILCAPFADNGATAEEKKLQQQYEKLTGQEHRWLKEHADYGLPKLSEVYKYFEGSGYSAITFGHSSLKLWRILMGANLLSHEMGTALAHKRLQKLNQFYNSVLFEDFAHDSYRSFIVLSKKYDLHLKLPRQTLAAESALGLSQLLNDFFEAVLADVTALPLVRKRLDTLTASHHHLEGIQSQYQHIINSRTWRYTAPLRSINRIVKKLRHGKDQV